MLQYSYSRSVIRLRTACEGRWLLAKEVWAAYLGRRYAETRAEKAGEDPFIAAYCASSRGENRPGMSWIAVIDLARLSPVAGHERQTFVVDLSTLGVYIYMQCHTRVTLTTLHIAPTYTYIVRTPMIMHKNNQSYENLHKTKTQLT